MEKKKPGLLNAGDNWNSRDTAVILGFSWQLLISISAPLTLTIPTEKYHSVMAVDQMRGLDDDLMAAEADDVHVCSSYLAGWSLSKVKYINRPCLKISPQDPCQNFEATENPSVSAVLQDGADKTEVRSYKQHVPGQLIRLGQPL